MAKVDCTPGKWKAALADINAIDGDDHEQNRWSVLTDNGEIDYFIATIENGAPGDTLQTEEANARAIAAVPEMIGLIKKVARGATYAPSTIVAVWQTEARDILNRISVDGF